MEETVRDSVLEMMLWKDLNADPSIHWPLWRRVRWGLSYGVVIGSVVFLVSLLFTDWSNGLVYERAGPYDLNALMASRLIGMPLAGVVIGALLPMAARRYGGYVLGPIALFVTLLPSMLVPVIYLSAPAPRWQAWIALPFTVILSAVMGQQMSEPLRGKPMGKMPETLE
jgi:hypothetical protein